jgi:hypothetical protein
VKKPRKIPSMLFASFALPEMHKQLVDKQGQYSRWRKITKLTLNVALLRVSVKLTTGGVSNSTVVSTPHAHKQIYFTK